MLLGRLELFSRGLDSSGCWQHYRGSHSILRQRVSQKSGQGSELYSNVGWCQAVMADGSVPTVLQNSFRDLGLVQRWLLPPLCSSARTHPAPSTTLLFISSVLSLFFSFFPSSHPTFYFMAYYHQGLSRLIYLFYSILIRTFISQPHQGQPS